MTYFKRLEADIAVVKTVNNRLVERVIKKERPCWENAQYSRRDTLEIDGIPNLVGNTFLEETVCGVFKKIGVEIDEQDVQACHHLKEKKRTIVKFFSRKDCLQILRMKKDLKSLDPRELDFPEKHLLIKVYVLIIE